MRIIDRYITKETLSPFFLGIVGFVMVMTVDLLFTFVDLIINKGIPFFAVMELLLYKLPSILILTFPVATLFGVAMAIGRLSKDNEISALRTSGVSFGRIAAPILIISVIISLVSFFTNEKIVPYANQKSQKIIREILLKQPLPAIQENIFFKDAYNRHFYVQKINNREKTMENVMVYELIRENLPRIVTAKSAKLEGLKLTLNSGLIHKFDNNGQLAYEASFEAMEFNLNENAFAGEGQKTTEEMNTTELEKQIDSLKKSGVSVNSLQTDLFMKYSIPATSIIFAIIGLTLSLSGMRSSRTWGMVFTIVIMFTFYVFASVFRSLGRGGAIAPFFAAFTPQIFFGILGLVLLIREIKLK
ncbi:LptF/LptG family permease [Candidatus Saganbacteria bacterium]|nr:LptF/LptG family permease [Candidatus Saganbacteria bacterium]